MPTKLLLLKHSTSTSEADAMTKLLQKGPYHQTPAFPGFDNTTTVLLFVCGLGCIRWRLNTDTDLACGAHHDSHLESMKRLHYKMHNYKVLFSEC